MNALIGFLVAVGLFLYVMSRNLRLLSCIIEEMTVIVVKMKVLWYVVTQYTIQETRDEERESTSDQEN
jgi:hypothetical protein